MLARVYRASRAYRILPFVAVLAVLLASGCGKEPRSAAGYLDTPRHHYENGLRFLDDKDLDRASREFDLALEMDENYGPAVAGQGVVLAWRGDEDGAMDRIDDGLALARDDSEEMDALTAELRAWAALGQWHEIEPEVLAAEGEDAFSDALDLVDDNPSLDNPELYFFMGEVSLQAMDFASAETMFRRAAEMGGPNEDRAEARWSMVQDISRAAPRTSIGRRIALVDRITRADMAALLVEELDLSSLFAPSASAAFSPPGVQGASQTTQARVTDIDGHPLRSDIEVVLAAGIRGLQPLQDGSFEPDAPMSRAEVALVLEDVIVRATNNPALATMFIGQRSPFADLRADHPAFNAVMVCTTRGLVAGDAAAGNFRPGDPYTGAEAVLSINRLRMELDRL